MIWHQSLAAAKSASDQPTKLTMHLQSEQMQPLIHLEGLGEIDALPTALLESCQRVLLPKHGQRVHAISGIGYPKRFFDTLRGLGFEVIEHPFPDHYAFTWSDLLPFNEHPIVMTSKDAVKFRALIPQLIEALRVEQAWVSGQATIALKEAQTVSKEIEQIAKGLGRVWVLPVQASLSASCYDVLEKQLTTLNIHFTSV